MADQSPTECGAHPSAVEQRVGRDPMTVGETNGVLEREPHTATTITFQRFGTVAGGEGREGRG